MPGLPGAAEARAWECASMRAAQGRRCGQCAWGGGESSCQAGRLLPGESSRGAVVRESIVLAAGLPLACIVTDDGAGPPAAHTVTLHSGQTATTHSGQTRQALLLNPGLALQHR